MNQGSPSMVTVRRAVSGVKLKVVLGGLLRVFFGGVNDGAMVLLMALGGRVRTV